MDSSPIETPVTTPKSETMTKLINVNNLKDISPIRGRFKKINHTHQIDKFVTTR
jgi:hypothetical protein